MREVERSAVEAGGVTIEVVTYELRHGVFATRLRQTGGEPLTPRMWRDLADELGLVELGGGLAGAGVRS